MSRSVDETRRTFLKRLAKTVAFVPPVMATLDVSQGGGQGPPGGGGGSAGGTGGGAQTFGGLTPTASTLQGTGDFQIRDQEGALPWNPGASGGEPPWSKPPPTQTGR